MSVLREKVKTFEVIFVNYFWTMIRILVSSILSMLCLEACVHQPVPPPTPLQEWEYLFLAHPRHNNKDLQRVDSLVEKIPFDSYDAILLGGDLTANSSREDSTLKYLDELFDLSSPKTLLAPGNHDVDKLDRLLQYTQKPSFYTYTENNITFVVLDTQKDNCSIRGNQLNMLQNIADTLTQSDQLVIIHHKLLWMPGNPVLANQISQVSNAGICPFEFCLFENNFWEDVYPLLLDIKNQGKQVILIGGDLGFKTKYFEYITPEGIVLLGSGINQGDPDNPVLLLKKDSEMKTLSWESVLIDSVLKK